MKALIRTLVLATATVAASSVLAETATPRTLAEAVERFSGYNQRLEQAMSQEMTAARMAEIHELTYGLQAALEKMIEEMDGLNETLEEVLVASEAQDADELKGHGANYLKAAQPLIK
nr:hypothetical protein [Pseudomonas sp.]